MQNQSPAVWISWARWLLPMKQRVAYQFDDFRCWWRLFRKTFLELCFRRILRSFDWLGSQPSCSASSSFLHWNNNRTSISAISQKNSLIKTFWSSSSTTTGVVGSVAFSNLKLTLHRPEDMQKAKKWYFDGNEKPVKALAKIIFEQVHLNGTRAGHSLTCPTNDPSWVDRVYKEPHLNASLCSKLHLRQGFLSCMKCRLRKCFFARIKE